MTCLKLQDILMLCLMARSNRKSGMGVGDQLGVKSVATEIINARLAQEQMQEIATMVDFRFGHGTWKSITEERARRIQAAKEAAMQARREKLRQQRELEETIKNVVLTLTVVVVAFGFFVFLFMVVL